MIVSFTFQSNQGQHLTPIQKYVNCLVVKQLDVQKCFSGQKSEAIKKTIRDIAHKFGIEDVYTNDWPIREALKLRLKYTSESARKQRVRRTEKALKVRLCKPAMHNHD
jgi:hypothetical protein